MGQSLPEATACSCCMRGAAVLCFLFVGEVNKARPSLRDPFSAPRLLGSWSAQVVWSWCDRASLDLGLLYHTFLSRGWGVVTASRAVAGTSRTGCCDSLCTAPATASLQLALQLTLQLPLRRCSHHSSVTDSIIAPVTFCYSSSYSSATVPLQLPRYGSGTAPGAAPLKLPRRSACTYTLLPRT